MLKIKKYATSTTFISKKPTKSLHNKIQFEIYIRGSWRVPIVIDYWIVSDNKKSSIELNMCTLSFDICMKALSTVTIIWNEASTLVGGPLWEIETQDSREEKCYLFLKTSKICFNYSSNRKKPVSQHTIVRPKYWTYSFGLLELIHGLMRCIREIDMGSQFRDNEMTASKSWSLATG